MAILSGPVLQGFPFSADEYAYVYQARTFLEGRVVNPPAPDPSAYHQIHLISTPNGMYSKYPPGWPVVLAVGEAAGLGWLVNPLITGLLLVLCWVVARRWAGDRVATLLTVILCTNPYLLMNGAGLYPHPWVTVWVLILFFGLMVYKTHPRTRTALGAGLAIALILLARPQDLVFLAPLLLVAVPIALRGVAPTRVLRDLLVAALPVLGAGGAYLAYNAATTGDPWTPGHLLLNTSDRPAFNLLLGLRINADRLLRYLEMAWVLFAVPLGLFAVPAPARRRWLLSTGLGGLFVAGWVLYLFPDARPEYGPRYFFTAHPFLMLAAAWALSRLLRPRWVPLCVGAIAVIQLAQTGFVAYTAGMTIEAAQGPARAAALLRTQVDEPAWVILSGAAGSVPRHDLVRNDLLYGNPVQFVRADSLQHPLWNERPNTFLWDGAGGPAVLTATTSAGVGPDGHPEPLRLIYDTNPPILLGWPRESDGRTPDALQGWAITTATNRCAKRSYEYPGSRSLDWTRFVACPPVEFTTGRPPGPGEAWTDTGTLWFTRHYRTTLFVEHPGTHWLEVLADDEARVYLDGVEILRARSGRTHVPVSARIELSRGPHSLVLAFSNIGLPAELSWSLRDPLDREVPAAQYRIPTPPVGTF